MYQAADGSSRPSGPQRPGAGAIQGRFRLLRVEQVLAMPLPTWLVEGIVPSDSIGQIYGRSGHFKSFVTLDLALSIATGLRWMDHIVEAGPTVYVAGEGARGLIGRIHAWKDYHDLTRS